VEALVPALAEAAYFMGKRLAERGAVLSMEAARNILRGQGKLRLTG
jgi:hypothetical protein